MKKLLIVLMVALPLLAAAALGCTDTDGNDPYTSGSCSPSFGGTYYDECTTTKYNEVAVIEYTCQGTVCQPYTIACAEGYCYGGACQTAPEAVIAPAPVYEEATPIPSISPVPSTVIKTPTEPKEEFGPEVETINLNDIGLVVGAVVILVAVAWFTTRSKPPQKAKAAKPKAKKRGKKRK